MPIVKGVLFRERSYKVFSKTANSMLAEEERGQWHCIRESENLEGFPGILFYTNWWSVNFHQYKIFNKWEFQILVSASETSEASDMK